MLQEYISGPCLILTLMTWKMENILRLKVSKFVNDTKVGGRGGCDEGIVILQQVEYDGWRSNH